MLRFLRKQMGFWMVGLALLIGVAIGRQNNILPSAAPVDTAPVAPEPVVPAAKYLLQGYRGKIAVFFVGKTEPEVVLDRYLHHLPDLDRAKLEEGIPVADYAKLLQLLEDYTS